MKFFKVEVKKSLPFFKSIIEKFCGNSFARFDGNLSKVDFSLIVNSFVPQFPDKSNIVDSITFPLTDENKNILLGFLPRIGIRTSIYQIFIEQDGLIVYVSNDSFDKEMVSITADVGEEFIKQLIADGILWKYTISEWGESELRSFTQQVFRRK